MSPLFITLLIFVQFGFCVNFKMRPPGTLLASQDTLTITYQNNEYFKGTVNITNSGTPKSTSYIQFTILKTPPNNLIIQITPIKQENGQFHAGQVTPIKHGICTYIKNDKILYPGFVKYGTLPRSCPIKPGNYFVHGYQFPTDNLPPMALPGKYKLIFDVGNDQLKILTIEWIGSMMLK